jgi:hypothetical protein
LVHPPPTAKHSISPPKREGLSFSIEGSTYFAEDEMMVNDGCLAIILQVGQGKGGAEMPRRVDSP